MSINSQNNKFFSSYGNTDEKRLKEKIIKVYQDFSNDPELKDCWIDCIAIKFDIDNNEYIRQVIAGRI